MAAPQFRTHAAGHSTTAATSHTIPFPSGVVNGDLVVLFLSIEELNANSDPPQSDWDSLISVVNSTLEFHSYKHKYLTGEATEVEITFNDAHNIAWVIVRVDSWSGDLDDVDGNTDVGTSANPDPPSTTLPSGDKLLFSIAGWRDDYSHSSYSSGYSANTITSRYAASGGVGIASSTKTSNSTSENPGQHTLSGSTLWHGVLVYVNNNLLTKEVADALALGESTTRVATYVRTITDPITLGETCTRAGTFVRALSDPISLGESCTQIVTLVQSASDPLGLGESCTPVASFAKSISDSLSIGESISTSLSGAETKSVSDSLALGESCTRVASFAKSIADVISLADTSSQLVTLTKSVADGLTIYDAVEPATRFVKSIANALVLGESVASQLSTLHTKSVSDAVSLSESVSRVAAFARSIADAISTSDSVASVAAFAKSIADALSVGESLNAGAGITKSIADAMLVGESLSKVCAFAKSISDSLSVAESTTRVGSFFKSLADPLTLAEFLVGNNNLVRGLADTLSVQETFARVATYQRTFAETMSLTDQKCTTASIDIVVNPNLVTVSDTGIFSVGDRIVIANAVGAGQDLVTVVTAVNGNQLTIRDAAAATISGESICRVTGGNWFGDNDSGCGCCGECNCLDAVEDFPFSTIEFTGGPSAKTFYDADDQWYNCFTGRSDPVYTYSFPGVSNFSEPVGDTCFSNDVTDIEFTTDGTARRFTLSASAYTPPTCSDPGVTLASHPFISLSGSGFRGRWGVSIQYECRDGQPSYILGLSVSYPVYVTYGNLPPDSFWQVGNEQHSYVVGEIFAPSGTGWYVIQYEANIREGTSISLNLASSPDYARLADPAGFLVGTATLS